MKNKKGGGERRREKGLIKVLRYQTRTYSIFKVHFVPCEQI